MAVISKDHAITSRLLIGMLEDLEAQTGDDVSISLIVDDGIALRIQQDVVTEDFFVRWPREQAVIL